MTRRTRLASTALVLALAASVLPASAGSAQSGTPLRPVVRDQADPTPPVVLRGSGWGHSVGLSQYGAFAMAVAGRSHSDILQHYYPGTRLRTAPGEDQQRVTVRLATGAPTNVAAEAIGRTVSWRLTTEAGTDTVVQPSGSTWRVRTQGAGVLLDRDTAADLPAVRVEAFLTAMDEVEPAAGTLRTYHPSGTKRYAYGRIMFARSGSGLAISNRLPLESYLRGLGEVPSSWGGPTGGQEALEAQAIIARGYALANGLDLCATPACQVFSGYDKEAEATGDRWVAAVRDTRGRYLEAPGGGHATTFYSSSHGGRTEASQDSWAYGGAVPYLVSVDDPWSLQAPNPMRAWTAVATNAEFRRVTGLGLSRVERVTVTSRTDGGSPRVLRVAGPEGTFDFSTTTSAARSRSCNRTGYAGNSLRCDLAVTQVRQADGALTTRAGNRLPSSQVRSIGFSPFTDDDGGVHEYATVWAHEAGIAEGRDATTFAPRAPVTRAQMASFLYRTFDVPERTDEPFTDVAGGPHAVAIASVSAAGIARGYDDDRFGPNDPVTREQMASFLARAMGLSPVQPSFSDVPPNGTHAGNVGAIAQRGITTGCTPQRYCPSDAVTRDQMTTFLHRAVRSLR